MSESSSTPVGAAPKPLSPQFFDVAQNHRARARELRTSTPGSPNLDADALDALAEKLESNAIEIDTHSAIKRADDNRHSPYCCWPFIIPCTDAGNDSYFAAPEERPPRTILA